MRALFLPFFIAVSMALAGGGVAVTALNLSTHSPRLLGAGIAATLVGILMGAIGLRGLRVE
jgi:hypothetical protein